MDDAAQPKADGVVRLPARDIPPPDNVSDQARAALAAPRPPAGAYPAVEDQDGWRRLIASRDRANAAASSAFASRLKADVAARTMAGVPVYVGTPQGERLRGERHV